MGTSQLLSVPYALHAETAKSVTGAITETDPVYGASQSANITATDITNLGNLSGTNTGDQDISGISTNATSISTNTSDITTNATAIALNTAKDTTGIYHDNRTALDAVSGTNTGDQDLSGKVDVEAGKGLSTNDYTNAEATKLAAITGTNTGDQTLSGLGGVASNTVITGATKTKVTYDAKGLVTAGADATTADIAASTDNNYVTDAQLTVIGNTSNTNTGDQDLNGLATTTAVTTGLALKVDKEAGKDLEANGTAAGQMQYWNGTAWVTVASGLNGQILKYKSGVPTWSEDEIINILSIGDSYQGGIIAYFLVSGDPGYDANVKHGIIAATADQSTGQWYNGSYIITGATGIALGTGSANTTAIIASQENTGSYAAKICKDYTGGGYTDWYLPSKDELNKLYLNKAEIGGFASNDYWSSTEYSNTSAGDQGFTNGIQYSTTKNTTYRVRAVRAF